MMEKIKKLFEPKRMTMILSFLGLYLLSAGISLAVFSNINPTPETARITDELKEKIAALPKTEQCPINGGMFTTIERDIWETRRPVAAMVENHIDARPLSGLSRADVVYETNAEGGITRFLGIFYCGASAEDLSVAVIRSARVYYIKWAAEYGTDPIFLHWGGANNICNNCPHGTKPYGQVDPKVNAYSLLDKLGWYRGPGGNDFDGGYSIGFPIVVRLPNRLSNTDAATEHQPNAYLTKVWEEADERGYGFENEGDPWTENFTPWEFGNENPLSSPKATEIGVVFWEGKEDYDVKWTYNAESNSYLRENGGEPFVDHEYDGAQIAAKTVVVQYLVEKGPVDEEFHMYYENVDDGVAVIFQNGDVIEGTWEKESITGRTMFYDEAGDPVEFAGGQIWIEGVPKGLEIEYN